MHPSSQGGLYNANAVAPPGEPDARLASSEVWAVHTLGTDYREHVTTTEEAVAVAIVAASRLAPQAIPALLRWFGARGTITAAQLLKPPGGVQTLARLTQWTRGGQGLAGQEAALAKTAELIKALPGRIGVIRAGGVTKEMAQQWAAFYRQVAAQNPVTATAGNPNALARSKLMQAIADLL